MVRFAIFREFEFTLVDAVNDGDALTSISHGLSARSIIMSKPSISKHDDEPEAFALRAAAAVEPVVCLCQK